MHEVLRVEEERDDLIHRDPDTIWDLCNITIPSRTSSQSSNREEIVPTSVIDLRHHREKYTRS